MAKQPDKKQTEQSEVGDFTFFSESDLKPDGTPASEYPSWFYELHLEDLEESVRRKERQLERGLVHPEMIHRVKNELEMEKARLEKLKEGRPQLKGKMKDAVYSAYRQIARQLHETLPTRRDEQEGFVRPYDELKRWNARHITVDPKIARACGINTKDGKITGKQAQKCYQILGKALGENTNVERLRRDYGSESFKTIDPAVADILNRMRESVKRINDGA